MRQHSASTLCRQDFSRCCCADNSSPRGIRALPEARPRRKAVGLRVAPEHISAVSTFATAPAPSCLSIPPALMCPSSSTRVLCHTVFACARLSRERSCRVMCVCGCGVRGVSVTRRHARRATTRRAEKCGSGLTHRQLDHGAWVCGPRRSWRRLAESTVRVSRAPSELKAVPSSVTSVYGLGTTRHCLGAIAYRSRRTSTRIV